MVWTWCGQGVDIIHTDYRCGHGVDNIHTDYRCGHGVDKVWTSSTLTTGVDKVWTVCNKYFCSVVLNKCHNHGAKNNRTCQNSNKLTTYYWNWNGCVMNKFQYLLVDILRFWKIQSFFAPEKSWNYNLYRIETRFWCRQQCRHGVDIGVDRCRHRLRSYQMCDILSFYDFSGASRFHKKC